MSPAARAELRKELESAAAALGDARNVPLYTDARDRVNFVIGWIIGAAELPKEEAAALRDRIYKEEGGNGGGTDIS